jgi:hypothetical protein
MKVYDELRSSAREAGAVPAVIYAPASYRIHPGDRARWAHITGEIAGDPLPYEQAFCDYLTSSGLLCVNLAPPLLEAAAAGPERLYYWLDVHWTARGNQVAAQTVAQALDRLGAQNAHGPRDR